MASRRMFRHTARFVRWRPGRDRRSAPAACLLACPDLMPASADDTPEGNRGHSDDDRHPPPTLYHRWLGWHAPAMRRAITVLIAGLIVAVVLLPSMTWGLALARGWNAAALTFLLTTWPVIIRADSSRPPQLAARDDQTEGSARVLLVGASVASLLGAGYALHLAGRNSGVPRMPLIGAAALGEAAVGAQPCLPPYGAPGVPAAVQAGPCRVPLDPGKAAHWLARAAAPHGDSRPASTAGSGGADLRPQAAPDSMATRNEDHDASPAARRHLRLSRSVTA